MRNKEVLYLYPSFTKLSCVTKRNDGNLYDRL